MLPEKPARALTHGLKMIMEKWAKYLMDVAQASLKRGR
jgi:hypothetical protein